MAVQTRASKKAAPDNKSITAQGSIDTNRASVPAKRKMAGDGEPFRRFKMPRGEGAPCCESPEIVENDQGEGCYNCRKGFERGGKVNMQPTRSILGQIRDAPQPTRRGGTTSGFTYDRHPIRNDMANLGLTQSIPVPYSMSLRVFGDDMLSEVNQGGYFPSDNVGLQPAQAHGNTVDLQAIRSRNNRVDQEPVQSLPQPCCASPDIVEDELGQSCANCGESFTGATVVGSFTTGTSASIQALSNLPTTLQDGDYPKSTMSTSNRTSDPIVKCCNNPEPLVIDEGDDIHCFNCGTILDPSILLGPVDDGQIVVASTKDDSSAAAVDSVGDADLGCNRSHPCCTNPNFHDGCEADVVGCVNCGATHVVTDVNATIETMDTKEPGQANSVKNLSATREEESADWNDASIGALSKHTIVPNPESTQKSTKRGGSRKRRTASPKGARVFHKFSELPKEIRAKVYTMVLQSDLPIRPHLCNTRTDMPGTPIKFHDENRFGHNTVYASLAITRVSKQVRRESLPVFYGANTFETVADTPTYFLRLQQIGRFDMIRKVTFGVQFWNSPNYSQKVLRMLLQNLAEQEAFEKKHRLKQEFLCQLDRTGLDVLESFKKQNFADEEKFEELPMSLEDSGKKKTRTLSLNLGDPASSKFRFTNMAIDPLSRRKKSHSADLGNVEAAFKLAFKKDLKSSEARESANPQASTTQGDNLQNVRPSKAGPEALPHLDPANPHPLPFCTNDLVELKSHPLHQMGGLEPNFLVLRMLSAAFQGEGYNRKLVLHVPVATLFEEYNGLLYFPSVCEGLGIQLQLVSGRELEPFGEGFKLSWRQKFQQKDFAKTTTAKGGEQELMKLTKRVQGLHPNIEQVPRPSRRTYYRNTCKTGELEWYTIDTAGGGLS
ncbi:hypothetical protein GRF29_106g498273 [Pseudopithomyces chartarum]|uniref:2EXR domain-containing protein n=1 Tax=Pseudopithomyces chartarum TaxID=1892770 RepID=A0AAN6LV09_9PLEO|nr:hypothetical protein GRF29_106g498273 [Pseudopithomyces chartarum]